MKISLLLHLMAISLLQTTLTPPRSALPLATVGTQELRRGIKILKWQKKKETRRGDFVEVMTGLAEGRALLVEGGRGMVKL